MLVVLMTFQTVCTHSSKILFASIVQICREQLGTNVLAAEAVENFSLGMRVRWLRHSHMLKVSVTCSANRPLGFWDNVSIQRRIIRTMNKREGSSGKTLAEGSNTTLGLH